MAAACMAGSRSWPAAGARMPQKEALRVLSDVASAIDYAHGRGMLHRDIKPANVLLDHDGDAFLSDFGIARILSDTTFTTTGALIGTPQYMSPEQGKGLPLTEATDLYSLGIVLYEMLTGRAPYDSDTPLGVIHKHIYEPLPSPRLACPDLRTRCGRYAPQVACQAAGGPIPIRRTDAQRPRRRPAVD